MNDIDKACIKFGQFINENYTTHGQYWTPVIEETKVLILTTKMVYEFYKWLTENYKWIEEPGEWFEIGDTSVFGITLIETYRIYKSEL